MSLKEKALLCQSLSILFAPPSDGTIEDVGKAEAALASYVRSRGGDEAILRGLRTRFSSQRVLMRLREEYDRLFSEMGPERIPLVESAYKPWTNDPHCPLPFAKEKGFVMGDSALHLLALFERLGLEVEGPFKGMPDHIAIELEFLSYLFEGAGEEEARRFITDHLDWVPSLKERLEEAQAHPFYMSLVQALDFFVEQEKREGWRIHGEKDVHREIN